MDINEFLATEPAVTSPLNKRYPPDKLAKVHDDLKVVVLKERAGFIPQSNRALARFFYGVYQVKISPKTVGTMLVKLRSELRYDAPQDITKEN